MKYWPLDHVVPRRDATMQPLNQVVSFSANYGPPITRRRTTAHVEVWSLSVTLKTRADHIAFEDWFDNSLGGGGLPFVWRHPTRDTVGRFKFTPATFTASFLSDRISVISFSVMALPGYLWLADYVADGSSRAPAFVADYENGIFGIDDSLVPASEMATVAGVFDLVTVPSSGNTVEQNDVTITASDIATTSTDRRIVGYDVV